MNKRFDFSFLPDGFLIEYGNYDFDGVYVFDTITRMNESWRKDTENVFSPRFRPMLNYDHFNDGSLVLPDGLVVELTMTKTAHILKGYTSDNYVICNIRKVDICCMSMQEDYPMGVKIVGAHPDYADHAKELGIPVIDISEAG